MIGCSAGGINVLSDLLPQIPSSIRQSIVVVLHLPANSNDTTARLLDDSCSIRVKEAEDKEVLEPSVIYFAPANYHLLIEKDFSFALSSDEAVNFSRPSIDVLFESAAKVYDNRLICIVLSGASQDGSAGLKHVRERGGVTIVQDPDTAEAPFMPSSALKTKMVDHRLSVEDIAQLLLDLIKEDWEYGKA